ncbi:MAG: PQQ-binding-like beta-propeller repeat protein [Candidatus Bathyarchaeota archaeon]|nr:PQQ-binding-like beta-propeller repeat protein [Candidatus Bathyarchaeota archaeon]
MILVTSIAASTMLLPTASAHNPPQQLTTNAYIAALPNPIGLNQSTLIYMWLNRVYGYYPNDNATGIAYAAVNNEYRFHNFMLTITAPDGTNTSQTFATIADTTSSQSYLFTPSMVGTYTFTFNFPGQAYNSSGGAYNPTSILVNDYYLPSSANTTLVVQEDPIFTYPDSYPLPSEYWTRPIYGENTFWWTISNNWLGTGAPGYGAFTVSYNLGGNGAVFYAGDTIGPLTSHIMWTKPLTNAGVVGGDKFTIPGNVYFEGSAYNQRYQNPIIVDGRIYYTEPISFTGYNSGPTVCVDLRTGEKLWSRSDVPPLSLALVWDHEDPNQHGVYPSILCTANFARLFDGFTGEPLFNVTGVPTGTAVMGPNGEQIRYVFANNGTAANPSYYLAQWNSTKLWNFGTNPYTGGSLLSPSIINATYMGNPNVQALITTFPIPRTGTTATLSTGQANQVVPYGSTLQVNGGVNNASNAQNRFDWSVPVSWRNPMTSVTVVGAIYNDIMLLYNGSLPSQGATFMGNLGFSPYTYFAINLNASRGTVGSILWSNTVQPPAGNLTVLQAGIDPVNRVFVENLRETQNFIGYNLDTGAKLWGPSTPQADFDYYGSQASGSLANTFAYGRMYSSAYAGIVYCYDTLTGDVLWTYGNGGEDNSTNSGFQVPGNYPTFVNAIGNDVVYLVTSEHTVETPLFKGALTRAINATTGEQIWTLSSYVTEFTTSSFAAADGYATWFNSYDNSIYVVGRGPSAITVNAPSTGFGLGGSLIISGRVTDIAAGTNQQEQAARFPNGVPVSSDASMSEWMAYVYQQKPMPTNFTGVEVMISVVDANNNFRNIGTATTDATGTYVMQWVPDIEGKYMVLATFAGNNGYWPSTAETAFAVDSTGTHGPTETPTGGGSVADQYFIPAFVALLVLIIIVLILVALLFRKR